MPGGAKTNANGLVFEAKVDLLGQFDGIWFDKFEVISASQDQFLSLPPSIRQDCDPDWNDRKADTGIMITNLCNGMRSFLIIEKKYQEVKGSVDSKLLAGQAFRKIWTRTLDVPDNNLVEVRYAFVVNKWMWNKLIMKKADIRYILESDNIPLFSTGETDVVMEIHNIILDMFDSL
jgi:hypothetical protein